MAIQKLPITERLSLFARPYVINAKSKNTIKIGDITTENKEVEYHFEI